MTSSDILDWSEEVPTDEGIEEYELRRYPPNAGGQAMLNQPGQIRFSIESGDIFTHPHRSYIQISGRVVKRIDGTRFENADQIALANNGLMYLFNQVRYEIAGREIETLLFPGQATTMLGLLEYTEDFSKTRGISQGWVKDVQTYAADGAAHVEASQDNPGFRRRQQYLLTSNGVNNKGDFIINIPLSHIFGFCKDYDKIIYGVKHELFFTRKDDYEPLYSGAGVDNAKIEINNMYWFVPIVKPAISNLNNLMSDMSKNINLKIDFDKRQVFSVVVPRDNLAYTWNLTTKAANEKPRFIVVGFQTGTRATQVTNPATFDNVNIREIHIYLNNVKRYPALDFTTDFNNNNYMDVYDAAANFRCLVSGLPSCISNFGIDPIDFKHKYPLFVFDISKQSATLKTSITNITVEMKFREGVAANTTAYAVVLSDNTMLFKSDGKQIRPDY